MSTEWENKTIEETREKLLKELQTLNDMNDAIHNRDFKKLEELLKRKEEILQQLQDLSENKMANN